VKKTQVLGSPCTQYLVLKFKILKKYVKIIELLRRIVMAKGLIVRVIKVIEYETSYQSSNPGGDLSPI
jgi:hypothetical protein